MAFISLEDLLHPKTFTEAIILGLIILIPVFTTLLLVSRIRTQKEGETHTGLVSFAGVVLAVAATAIPVSGVLPVDSISTMPYFFVLEGITAGFAAIYLGLGGKNRALLAYALTVAALSMLATVYVKNNMFPTYSITQEPLYTTGSLSAYQTGSVLGFYYLVPVAALIQVPLGMIMGLGNGISLLFGSDLLLVTMIGLWALFERFGMTRAFPALFLLLSVPELSFVNGRIDWIPYLVASTILVGLAAFRRPERRTVALLLPIATVMIFDHPLGPVVSLALLATLYALIRLRMKDGISPHPFASGLRLILVVTAVYWFSTYIYILVFTNARTVYQALVDFTSTLFSGAAGGVLLGSRISAASAPGYSDPSFYTFAYVWAAPAALALSYLLVTLLRRGKADPGEGIGEQLASRVGEKLGIASSISGIGILAAAYASYAVGLSEGQYFIPAAYFLLLIACAAAFNSILASRRTIVVALAAVALISVVWVGAYSPDWAPLEHTNFQVSATIHPYGSYLDSGTISSLIPANTTSPIYYDYDLSIAGHGGGYKPVRSVILGLTTGNQAFASYPGSLFVLLNSRLQKVSSAALQSDLVYSSNLHFIAYSSG